MSQYERFVPVRIVRALNDAWRDYDAGKCGLTRCMECSMKVPDTATVSTNEPNEDVHEICVLCDELHNQDSRG